MAFGWFSEISHWFALSLLQSAPSPLEGGRVQCCWLSWLALISGAGAAAEHPLPPCKNRMHGVRDVWWDR